MKKILFYISSLSKGGAERVLTNLANFLQDQNYKIVIVTNLRAKGEYEIPSVIQRRVIEEETTTSSNRVRAIQRRMQTLRNICKEEAPDLMISFMGKTNLIAMLATCYTKIPVVLSVRAEPALEYPSFLTRILANVLFAKSAGVICQTEDAKKFFSKKVQKKIVILPNSIQDSFIKPSFTGARKEEIVTVGRLDENKNHAMLIRAFQSIHKEFPQLILRIIGNGEDYQKLKLLIEKLQLQECVLLMGEQGNIEAWLYEAKVFVLCSNSEGMPNSLLEAMALGVPVISTDCPCGGPRMLIENGKNGFLIPVGGEEELKDKLRILLKNPEMAEELGQQANVVGEKHAPQKVNHMWQAYIESKIESKIKPKKRIAFYLGSLAQGGAERVVVNLSNYFVQNGYEVSIVTKLKEEPEYIPHPKVTRILADLTEEEIKNSRIANFCGRVRKLRSIWKHSKPQIIVSFIGKNNFMTLLSGRFLRIPIILSVRSAPEREYPKGVARILAKTFFGLADGIIVQTPNAKAFFPKRIQKKVIILPNSLNPQFIKERYEGIRTNEIVTVGRLDQNKNQRLIVDAFAPLCEKYPQIKVIMYGDGEARGLLEQLISEKGLQNKVILAGSQTDISNKIYKSRIFVLSSNVEGMPNALIEAMSLGLAVVATDCPCGGPNMLIQNQENGLLIPVGNSQALTEALEQILSNERLEESLGQNAAKIQERLLPQKVNEAWEVYLLSKIK